MTRMIDMLTAHLWITDLGILSAGYLLGRWHEQRRARWKDARELFARCEKCGLTRAGEF